MLVGGHSRKAPHSETKFASAAPLPQPLHTGLVPRILGLEADVVTLRDKCSRLETECKILYDHVRDLEEGRRQDRLLVEELRMHLLHTHRSLPSAGMVFYEDEQDMEMPSAAASSGAASGSGAASSKVAFRAAPAAKAAVAEEDDVAARREKVKKRVPTAFAKGAPAPDEDEEEEPPAPVRQQPAQQSKQGQKPASGAATGAASSAPKGRGLLFRDRDSVLEIDNCVTGEQGAGAAQQAQPSMPLRSAKNRVPTAFSKAAPAQDSKDSKVGFNPRDDESPDRQKVDDDSRRKLKSRVSTGYVKAAPEPEDDDEDSARQIKFDGELDGGEQRPGKKVKRVPTAFVHAGVQEEDDDDEESGEEEEFDCNHPQQVKIKAKDGVGEPRTGAKKRVPTAFVYQQNVGPDEDEDEDEEEQPTVSFKQGTTGEPRAGAKKRVPTAFARNVPADEEEEDEDERKGVSFKAGTATESRGSGKKRVPTAFPRNEPMDDEDDEEQKGVSFKAAAGGEPKSGKMRVPTAFPRNVPGDDEEEEETKGVAFKPGTGGEAKNGKKRVPTAFPRSGPGDDDDEEAEAKVKFKGAAGQGEPKAGKKMRVPTAFARSVDLPVDDEETSELASFGEDPSADDAPQGKKGVQFHGASASAAFESKKPKRVPTAFPRGQVDVDDDDETTEKNVKFNDQDQVQEICQDGDGKRRSVNKRVPTAFVKPFAGLDVDEEDEEEDCDGEGRLRTNSTRSATFNDAVSESDPDEVDEEVLRGGRPSRGRIATSFLRAVPGHDREKTQDSATGSDASPSKKNAGDKSPARGQANASQGSDPPSPARKERVRLPTALGRRKSEEDLTEIMVIHSPSNGTFDPVPLEINLERFRLIDSTKDAGLIERSLRNLDVFSDIDDDACKAIVDAMVVFSIPAGTAIARQGNRNATHFFIIEEGLFEITRDGKKVAEVAKGALLGESVILLSGAQNATVVARSPAKAYGLAGAKARNILQQQYQEGKKDVINAVRELLHGGVARNPLFRHLSQYQENQLFEGAEANNFASGEVLIARGVSESKGLYIVLKGSIKVTSHDEFRNYGRNAIVGELLMLYGQAPADIVCTSPIQTLRLPPDLLQRMFGDKLEDELLKSRIRSLILSQKPFDTFSDDQLDAVAMIGEVVDVLPGEEVVKDNVCLALCIFGEGVEGEIMDQPAEPGLVTSLKMSGVMGHTLGQDRFATGASASVSPWKLRARNRSDIQARIVIWGTTLAPLIKFAMMKRSMDSESAAASASDSSPQPGGSPYRRSGSLKFAVVSDDKVGALRKVIVFRTLTNDQLTELANSLQPMVVNSGDVLFNQGDNADEFYIIHSGVIEISINGRKVRTLSVGDYVGERALLYSEPRSATVTAVAETELWRISRDTFERVIVKGSGVAIVDYMKERIAFQNTKVEIESLKCMRVVGRGAFGVVKMVQSEQTKTRYALKCVSIKTAVRQDQSMSLKVERSILAELDHPFVIKFIRTFKTKQYVYFLMELVTGGELHDALQELQLLTKPQAQFYTGSIVLALEFLHERRIAYLDLKGENCLIDIHGYLKIIDFGIAERLVNGKFFELRGTCYYMAPEIILGCGYTTIADLWSLGVCVFDFLTGTFPFGADITDPANACGQNMIYEEIRKAELKFPKMLKDKTTKSFISGLLERDVTKRLGAGVEGYVELKGHPFFDGFKWDELMARQIPPPYKPHCEVYAEEEGVAEPEELVVVEDKPEEDNWEEVIFRGLTGPSAVCNGKYQVHNGRHDDYPVLKHHQEDLFVYHIPEGKGSWCISRKLGSAAASEVWIRSDHEVERRRVSPPSEGWYTVVATGNPKVKVYMDPDPSWLEDF